MMKEVILLLTVLVMFIVCFFVWERLDISSEILSKDIILQDCVFSLSSTPPNTTMTPTYCSIWEIRKPATG